MCSKLFLTAFVLFGAVCRETSWPPPPRRSAVARPVRAVMEMRADLPEPEWVSITQDVAPAVPGAGGRWVRRHPRFLFALQDSDEWRLHSIGLVQETR